MFHQNNLLAYLNMDSTKFPYFCPFLFLLYLQLLYPGKEHVYDDGIPFAMAAITTH